MEATGREQPIGTTSGREISYLSDNIVCLEMHLEDDLRRTIRVVKARGSAHSGHRHGLRITPQGLAVDFKPQTVSSLP